jgi:hypothetical protein
VISAYAALWAMAATLAAAAPALARQAEPPAPTPRDRWTVTVAPYLWATSLDGHAAVRGIKADVDVPFSDLLKDLSFGAMMLIDIEKDRFGIGVNGLFARVSSDTDVGPIEIDTTSDTGQLVIAPYYCVVEWAYRTSSSAGSCSCEWGRRRAFATPICPPSSRCAAAGPSTRARAGSIL